MPIVAIAAFSLVGFAEMTTNNNDLVGMPEWKQNLLLHVLHTEAKFGSLKAEAKLGRLHLPNNGVEERKQWLEHSAGGIL